MNLLLKIESIIKSLINFCRWISCITVVVMMLVIIYAIIVRGFNIPFVGDYELVQIMMLTIIALSLPYVQVLDAHISIELLTNRLSERLKTLFESFSLLVVFAVCALISYVFFDYASVNFNATGGSSELLRIPFFPFQLLVSLSFLLWALQSLIMAIKKISSLSNSI